MIPGYYSKVMRQKTDALGVNLFVDGAWFCGIRNRVRAWRTSSLDVELETMFNLRKMGLYP